MIDFVSSLKQLRYPPEFRIKAPLWSPDILRALQDLVNVAVPAYAKQSAADEADHARLLADLATNLWRLRQRMLQPGTDQPLEEMRRAYRPFEAAWDALLGAGIEIIDDMGSPFNSGLKLHVLAFQPTPGITEETVIETIRPSIYYKGESIQPGEVIVGIPDSSAQRDA